MRLRFAFLPFVMLATPLAAQEAAPGPRWSLVVAQSASTLQTDQWPDCGDAICVDRVSAGGFSGVTTLTGPDLGKSFGANLVIHQRLDREGALAIVRTDPDGSDVIERLARGGQGGRACLPEVDLATFGLADAPLERRDGYACHVVAGQLLDGEPVTVVPASALLEDVYPAIIDIWPLDGEYDGYYIPADVDCSVTICLGDSILIQKGSLDRVIAGNLNRGDPRLRAARGRDTDGQFLRFRMIGGHAARRIAEGRYLAVIEPTDQGYVYVQWREEYSGGRACFPADVMAHYGDRLHLGDARSGADGETCVAVR